uniref:Uncharacterized protein n=1 Tax=Aegilops tauschii TaxID=37682 RepID=M8BJ33_AEGTA
MSDRSNGTTATAFASNGLTVEVSFWFAAPPALSYFTVHCRGLDEQNSLAREPCLVCSDEYVAILSIDFTYTYRGRKRIRRDYFVYTAIPDGPSLVRLPNPFLIKFDPRTMGLLRTADGEGFVVAVLSPQLIIPGSYDLLIFSSKQLGWIVKTVQLQPKSPTEDHQTFTIDKVIALPEEGSLGWVDLWRGILVCNVLDLQELSPVLRFIPLPEPMAANMNMVDDENENCAWLHRDVAYVDGLIRFVEIETRRSITTRGPNAIRNMLIYADLELDGANTSVCHGWMAIAWVRKPSSDAWIKDCEADVDDINIDNPRYSSLPELRGSYSGKLTLKNLITANPTLGMHGSDVVVYLISKVKIHHENAWIVAINMTSKTLEDMASFSSERTFGFGIGCRPCAFFRHLDMTADHGEAGLLTKTSENSSAYTTVLVSGLDPCVTEDELRQILAPYGELHDMKMLQDQRSAVVKFVDRLCAENAICELNFTTLGSEYPLRLKREHVDSPSGQRKAKRDAERPRPYPEYYGADSWDVTMVDADGNRKRPYDTSAEAVARGGYARLGLFGCGVLPLPRLPVPPRPPQDLKRTKTGANG